MLWFQHMTMHVPLIKQVRTQYEKPELKLMTKRPSLCVALVAVIAGVIAFTQFPPGSPMSPVPNIR